MKVSFCIKKLFCTGETCSSCCRDRRPRLSVKKKYKAGSPKGFNITKVLTVEEGAFDIP